MQRRTGHMARSRDQGPMSPTSSKGLPSDSAGRVLAGQDGIREWQEDAYRALHQHPELSDQEVHTAAKAADALREAGFAVHEKIGTTGIVGVLKNGDGPTVLVRADMDALPMQEDNGLPYASTERHGYYPQLPLSPVGQAAQSVVRLQATVAREVAPDEFAVLTVGQIVAGTKSNIIPDHAVIELNIRAYSERTRTQLINAIERVV